MRVAEACDAKRDNRRRSALAFRMIASGSVDVIKPSGLELRRVVIKKNQVDLDEIDGCRNNLWVDGSRKKKCKSP